MSQDLGAVGRIRDGRVDTGEQVYDNVSMCAAEFIRRALTNNGFGLDDAHWYTHKRDGRQTKFVVSLAFSASDAPITEYNRETTEAFRDLAATPWYCHVWINPNGVLTVNFVSVQQGEPRRQVTVRNRVLGVVDVGDTNDVLTDGISLRNVKTVLVKFSFTNSKRIPPGIKHHERPSDAEMDQRHAAAVAKPE